MFSVRSVNFDIDEIGLFTIPRRVTEDDAQEYGKAMSTYRRYKAIPDSLKGPTFVSLDVTYRCNFSCKHCYLNCPQERKEMTTEKLKEVIHELFQMGVFTLCLCGGEPLVRDDCVQLIEYAKNIGIRYVNLVSNGWLLSKDNIEKLKSAGIDTIQISIDGSTPEIHDSIRKPGSFVRATQALELLSLAGIASTVSFCHNKLNAGDFPNVVRLGGKLGAKQVRTMYLLPTGRGEDVMLESEADYEPVAREINRVLAEEKLMGLQVEFGDPVQHIKLLPFLPTFTFGITCDGWILPSPYIPFSFGNVHHKSIETYWNEGLNKVWQNTHFLDRIKNIQSGYDLMNFEQSVAAGKYCDLAGVVNGS